MAIVRKKRPVPSKRGANSSGVNIADGEQARSLYRRYGFSSDPAHLVKFVDRLGIRLSRKPMEDGISGYLRRIGESWEMGVNSLHHPRRQRFTIAHELGHFFLHSGTSHKFEDHDLFRRDGVNSYMETEANQFAAEFLMPRSEFLAKVRAGITSVDELAAEFGVSTMAVRVRAKNLNIKGHGL